MSSPTPEPIEASEVERLIARAEQGQLDAAGRIDHVAQHGFQRTDADVIGRAPQSSSDAPHLHQVVLFRARAMSVDVADLVRLHPGFAQGFLDQERQGLAVGLERCHMMSFGQRSAGSDFRIDLGAPLLRVAEPLDDQHPRSFAQDEAVTVPVERTASLLRVIVIRQHAHLPEPGGEQRVDRVRTARQRDVALAVTDCPGSRQHGHQTAGTGCRKTQPRPIQLETIRQFHTRRVGQELLAPRHRRRIIERDGADVLVHVTGVTHVRIDETAEAARFNAVVLDVGVGQGLGGCQLTQRKDFHAAGRQKVQVDRRTDHQVGGNSPKRSQPPDSASALTNSPPHRFAIPPHRRDDPETRDDNPVLRAKRRWHHHFTLNLAAAQSDDRVSKMRQLPYLVQISPWQKNRESLIREVGKFFHLESPSFQASGRFCRIFWVADFRELSLSSVLQSPTETIH